MKAIYDFYYKINSNKEKPIVLLTKSNYYNEEKFSTIYNIEKNKNIIKNEKKINKKIDISDCLNLFNKEEILDEDNMWFCSNCKEYRKCGNKIQLFKSPFYLIIQLKRFKSNIYFSEEGENIIEENKNQTYITYPVENFDLSGFIYDGNKNKYLYDLYAIIVHKGTLNNGHYIAVCKNKGKWVKYDDEKLSYVDEPISGNTYILFYSRKE